MSIHLIVGNEIFLKKKEINNILNNQRENFDILSIDIDTSTDIEKAISDIKFHLMTTDFFNKSKVGIIKTKKYSNINTILENIEIISDEILIIDIYEEEKKDEIKKLKSNKLVKNKNVSIKTFFNLKNYQEKELVSFVTENLDKLGISFASKKDKIQSIDFIVKNSNLSYQNAFNELKKLEHLNSKTHTYKSIISCISDNLCTNRYYILDEIVNSRNKNDLFQILNKYIPKMKSIQIEFLCFDLISLIKDYILFKNGKQCLNKASYYKVKKFHFNIDKANLLINELNNIYSLARKNNPITKDLLYLSLLENFMF